MIIYINFKKILIYLSVSQEYYINQVTKPIEALISKVMEPFDAVVSVANFIMDTYNNVSGIIKSIKRTFESMKFA